MAVFIAWIVQWLGDVITLLLFIRALLSWIAGNPYSGARKVYDFLVKLTEPIVAPCRNLLSRFYNGPIDFSVLGAMIMVELISRILITILLRIA